MGYTTSVWKFCWDAVMEKLDRSIKDYEGLGRIFSDKLLKGEEKEKELLRVVLTQIGYISDYLHGLHFAA